MRIAGSIITLICGIVVVVGVFLAWYQYCEGVSGLGNICITLSGWNFAVGEANVMGMTIPLGGSLTGLYLVIAGGAAIILFALSAFIVFLVSKGGKVAVVILSIFAIFGSFMTICGCIWYIADILDVMDWIGGGSVAYGFYISAAAAVLGLIFEILTAIFAKGRE